MSKHRDCPALSRKISSQECGEHRNTVHPCTALCSFNPFASANYSQLLEAEDRLDKLAVEFLLSEKGRGDAMKRQFQKFMSSSPEALPVWLGWQIYLRCDESGRTAFARWEEQGLPGLKNDLKFLARQKAQTTLWLIEVQRVIDREQVLCKDLLRPELPPFVVRDRSMAAAACRYDNYLSFGFHLPHYSRVSGQALMIADFALPAAEAFWHIVRHLNGPAGLEGFTPWVAEHFADIAAAARATLQARHALGMKSVDLRTGRAVYKLSAAYAECREILDDSEDVAEDELSEAERGEGFAEARVWFSDGSSVTGVGLPSLGRILLGQSHWRLESLGEKKLRQLRTLVEALLGGRVQFEAERFDDIPARGLLPSGDTAKAVPALLATPPQFSFSSSRVAPHELPADPAAREETLLRNTDRQFLDDEVPALSGLTPRQAASDPAMRPRLLELLKQRINGADHRNLEQGTEYDPAWLLDELGIVELERQAPPKRPATAKRALPEPEYDFDDEEMVVVPRSNDPLAPALPLLTNEEAAERFDAVAERYPEPEDALGDMYYQGSTWIDDFDELFAKVPFSFGEDQLGVIDFALAMTWHVMVPPNRRVLEIPFPIVETLYNTHFNEIEKTLLSSQNFSGFVKTCLQPAILHQAMDVVITLAANLKVEPPLDILPFLMAEIDALHLQLNSQNKGSRRT